MKKRVLGLLLIGCLLLTASCGKNENKELKNEEKQETKIKTISCATNDEKTELEIDDDGKSIMGTQGQAVEYKYDTEKNELTEVIASIYVEFDDVSSDYISKQVDEAKKTCEYFKEDEAVKNCDTKNDGNKVEIYMEADVDKFLDSNEDISKTSSFEEIEEYAKKVAEDKAQSCTVK